MKILIKILIKTNDLILKIIDRILIYNNNGIHPKHELTKYYNFFIEKIEKNDSVLDIGCGNGYVAYKISQKASDVTGIDIDEKNISTAIKKHRRENLHFILGDATSFKFDRPFEAIVLSNVLEHIDDRINFLKKISRLSDKILIRVPMINRDWLTLYKKELGIWYFSDAAHYTEYTIESFEDEIKKAGLHMQSYSIQFGEIWAVIHAA